MFFNVGTDEHWLKIYEKAAEHSMDVAEFVAENAQTFIDFCKDFAISYDNFYRTSLVSHTPVAQTFWQKSNAAWDIYKKKYTWKYCVWCESFKTPKELVDGKCPDHNKEPIDFDEENYFFRLSSHKEALLAYIDSHEDFILPHTKREELRNFVKDMNDISISRHKQNLPWWVAVPWDDEQVMYVRFDALTNYVGAIGFPDDQEQFDSYWPWVQLCGPDNLRFQWAIWQGMLASAGLDFTKHILVHGMILWPDGNKMSKTLWNTISPFDQLHKYGAEAVRFYMLAGLPTYGDASYKEEDLVNLYNWCLANTFGNLLNRVIHLATKKDVNLNQEHHVQWELATDIAQASKNIADHYERFALYNAVNETHKLALAWNKYIDDKKPRDASCSQEEVVTILLDIVALLRVVIQFYTPVLPYSCQKALEALDSQSKIVLFEKITLTE